MSTFSIRVQCFVHFLVVCIFTFFSFFQCKTLRTHHIPIENDFLNKTDYERSSCQKKAFQLEDRTMLLLYAQSFSQGKAVYVELLSDETQIRQLSNIALKYDQKIVFLTFVGWGYRGLFGISPKTKPGKKELKITYLFNRIRKVKKSFYLNVHKEKFPVFKKTLKLGKFSDIDHAKRKKARKMIQESYQKKQQAFKSLNKDFLDHRLAHPRDIHYVTSGFWTKRVVQRYRMKKKRKISYRPKVSIHRGLDLKGKPGNPIYAIASGKVVLADRLYYEGNFTIIDHGNRILSGYMHQSKLLVKEGEEVEVGDLIGLVGASGRVTGPHLHIFVLIRGVYVDPLSILALPIRN